MANMVVCVARFGYPTMTPCRRMWDPGAVKGFEQPIKNKNPNMQKSLLGIKPKYGQRQLFVQVPRYMYIYIYMLKVTKFCAKKGRSKAEGCSWSSGTGLPRVTLWRGWKPCALENQYMVICMCIDTMCVYILYYIYIYMHDITIHTIYIYILYIYTFICVQNISLCSGSNSYQYLFVTPHSNPIHSSISE